MYRTATRTRRTRPADQAHEGCGSACCVEPRQCDLNLVGSDFTLVGSRSVPQVRLDPQTERAVECRQERLLARLALDHGRGSEVVTEHRIKVGPSGYLRRHQRRI